MDALAAIAPVLIGSTLLPSEEEQERRKPPPVSCGSRDIDLDALEGGFRYGEVTAIAGAPGTGKTTVSAMTMEICQDWGTKTSICRF